MNQFIAIALISFVSIGCVSTAATHLEAKNAKYPISMSKSFIDAKGKTYTPADYEKVRRFQHSFTQWNTLWGQVPLRFQVRLDPLLSKKIKQSEGDAIVNLTVESLFGHGYMFFSLFPIIPETAHVRLQGDIVRILPTAQE